MYDIADNQFTLIPHFIEDTTAKEPTKDDEKEDRSVFIGRFSKEKQLDHLLKAYNEFLKSGHQTKLALFGRDVDNQRAMMDDLIETYQLNDKVSIHKYTSNPLAEFKNLKHLS